MPLSSNPKNSIKTNFKNNTLKNHLEVRPPSGFYIVRNPSHYRLTYGTLLLPMKRILPLIFIAIFLFPAAGRVAFAAPKPADVASVSQSPAVTAIDVNTPKGLLNIYTQLKNLSLQTQLATDQLNANGLDTAQAQADLTLTNTTLAKAKIAITAPFGTIAAQNALHDAKIHLLASLNDLKALLPVLDTSGQS